MTDLIKIFKEYEQLAARADQAFQDMEKKYGSCVKCGIQCSDCCNAVFGIFFIESVYLNHHFNGLESKCKEEALLRAVKSNKDLLEMQKKLQEYGDDTQKITEAIGKERIRCPLLSDEQKCTLYPYRPITCRVYGIPTIINNRIHACWKAGFEKGETYPAFDLDGIYRELYGLSKKLLELAGENDVEKASLLVSASMSIMTPKDKLINGL